MRDREEREGDAAVMSPAVAGQGASIGFGRRRSSTVASQTGHVWVVRSGPLLTIQSPERPLSWPQSGQNSTAFGREFVSSVEV